MKKTLSILGLLLLILLVWKGKRIAKYVEYKSSKFELSVEEFQNRYSDHLQPFDSLPSNRRDVLAFANILGTGLDSNNLILKDGIGKTRKYHTIEVSYFYGHDGKDNHGDKLLFIENGKYPNLSLYEILFSNYDYVFGIESHYFKDEEPEEFLVEE